MGSLVLSNGLHTLRFLVTGKNSASGGYKVGIDSVSLSATQSERDGELFTPVNAHPAASFYVATNSGGTISAADMSGFGKAQHGKTEVRKELALIAIASIAPNTGDHQHEVGEHAEPEARFGLDHGPSPRIGVVADREAPMPDPAPGLAAGLPEPHGHLDSVTKDDELLREAMLAQPRSRGDH
jgi:hypothetical protein